MAKKAQKETHLQRLVKSLNTISTAKTPVTNFKKVTKTIKDLPKKLQPTEIRGGHRRILVPQAIREMTPPRGIALTNPSAGFESRTPAGQKALQIPTERHLSGIKGGYQSFDPRSGTWDRRSLSFLADTQAFARNLGAFQEDARMRADYNKNVSDVKTRNAEISKATKNNRLINKIRNSKTNIGKAVTSLKSSRGGYSKSRSSRG